MVGRDALVLAVDAGSPLVSVAVGRGGEVLAERRVEIGRSSERIMPLVEEALAAAGAGPRDLGGLVALRGPGSFTGLRVGLATVLGLHQALGIPATALPTLPVLAAACRARLGTEGRIAAAVDALRGEWFVQTFAAVPSASEATEAVTPEAQTPGSEPPTAAPPHAEPPEAEGEPRLVPAAELPRLAPCTLAGFGIGEAVRGLGAAPGLAVWETGPLAGAALGLIHLRPPVWDSGLLVRPLYLRPPAVTPAGRPRRVAPAAGTGRRKAVP